ncbi:hypothetical protein E2C01_072770 [Portunus trituberculatus]|uniref:Uncharacterized protein n=1 Tax=Portunus trituberculatus TaxID=210409 RepID=A0A5B7I8R7_PORTR|nr:hypothetical protein [Portunus trituberculatus]
MLIISMKMCVTNNLKSTIAAAKIPSTPCLIHSTLLLPGRSSRPLIMNTMVQWNHACFGILEVSKRTGSNPVHGLSVDWASSLGATVS